MAEIPVNNNLSRVVATNTRNSDDPPTEISPLNPAKPCATPSDKASVCEKDEAIDRKAFALLPALAIGVFLAAADQTIVVSSYGKIGSEMNELNKAGWLATA